MTILPASRPLAAAGCVIAAMAVIGLVDNLVILIAENAGLWQFHVMRAIMALPLILLFARIGKRRLRPVRVGAVVLRSFLLAVSMMFYFGALAFLPVAQTAAGLFTAPIFVLILSAVVQGQRPSALNVVAAIVGFAGILLVLQPDTANLSFAMVMPVAAGAFYAVAALITRGMCAQEGTFALLAGFFVMILVFGVVGCVVLELVQIDVPPGPDGFLMRGWQPMALEFLGLTAVQALGAVIGVGLIIRGYLLADAAFVVVFEYVLLIFAAGWSWVLWGQTLNGWAVLGIALIIVTGATLARSEQRGTQTR